MFETIKDLLFILLAAAGLIYIWKMILIFLLRNKTNKFIYVVVWSVLNRYCEVPPKEQC